MKNNVTAPDYYKFGGLEVITILRKHLTPEEYCGFLLGNIFKYLFRYKQKNGVLDLKKAKQYLEWLIQHEEKIPSKSRS